ncbi:hypothetical protein F5Y15DRAFT_413560 [Xylariaceae sp. FL0016]|nr:hypothetical protein F5Y15DRAFT_413560 [Xylariaceae sp. FL0016]
MATQKPYEKTVSHGAPMPKGYTFVPKGNAYRTSTCRRLTHAAGRPLYVVHNARRQAIGIRVPTATHAQFEARQDATADRRAAATTRRDDRIRAGLEAAIRDAFPALPGAEMAAVLARATEKHARRVGRTGTLDAGHKARLAVRAYVRHCRTPYERLLAQGVRRDVARQRVEAAIADVCEAWGLDEGGRGAGASRGAMAWEEEEEEEESTDDDGAETGSRRAEGTQKLPLPGRKRKDASGPPPYSHQHRGTSSPAYHAPPRAKKVQGRRKINSATGSHVTRRRRRGGEDDTYSSTDDRVASITKRVRRRAEAHYGGPPARPGGFERDANPRLMDKRRDAPDLARTYWQDMCSSGGSGSEGEEAGGQQEGHEENLDETTDLESAKGTEEEEEGEEQEDDDERSQQGEETAGASEQESIRADDGGEEEEEEELDELAVAIEKALKKASEVQGVKGDADTTPSGNDSSSRTRIGNENDPNSDALPSLSGDTKEEHRGIGEFSA